MPLSPPDEVSPLRPVRFDEPELLSWGDVDGADAFDVYRGDIGEWHGDLLPNCWLANEQSFNARDAQLPGVGNGFYYLVAGRNCAGGGVLGSTSRGALA